MTVPGMPEGLVLDPACARLVRALAGPPRLDRLGPHDGREALREMQDDRVEGPDVDVTFHTAPVGPRGLVGFQIVRPRGVDGGLPAVLYLHGGRFVTGDADTHGRVVRELAVGSGSALVLPAFTRPPEARFPVAVEEAYATLEWVAGHPGDLGLVPGRLAVAGDCTGGTIATVLTMVARRRGGPRLRAQLLWYPWLDSRCDSSSHRDFADLPILRAAAVAWYWEQYADRPEDADDPMYSPARASLDELAGLPPALVVTAEADVVRDEAETYAARLREAGVPVVATRYRGMVHDFVTLRPLSGTTAARAALREGAAFLADALGTPRP